MIALECVATFMAVINHGGFREAAKITGLSQPAVSQHVRRLEVSLSANLIQRSNAGCTLTLEGESFLPYARQLLRLSERVDTLFTQKSLIIGASSNTGIYLLQPYIKAYQDESPHQLKVIIGTNPDIADKLENHEIDVAIMEWLDERPKFDASLWRSEELVVIVPPTHSWAHRTSIPCAWLKGQALLGGEPGTGTGRLLRRLLGDDADTVAISMQLGSTEAVKHAVQAGLGISLVMACAVTEEHQNKRLTALRIEGTPPTKDLFVVRRRDTRQDTAAYQFASFLTA